MTTGTKNFVRITVMAGLLAWPGIETARLLVAKNQLTESAAQQRSVAERWASLKKLQVPAPAQPKAETAPVSNPTPTASSPSGI